MSLITPTIQQNNNKSSDNRKNIILNEELKKEYLDDTSITVEKNSTTSILTTDNINSKVDKSENSTHPNKELFVWENTKAIPTNYSSYTVSVKEKSNTNLNNSANIAVPLPTTENNIIDALISRAEVLLFLNTSTKYNIPTQNYSHSKKKNTTKRINYKSINNQQLRQDRKGNNINRYQILSNDDDNEEEHHIQQHPTTDLSIENSEQKFKPIFYVDRETYSEDKDAKIALVDEIIIHNNTTETSNTLKKEKLTSVEISRVHPEDNNKA